MFVTRFSGTYLGLCCYLVCSVFMQWFWTIGTSDSERPIWSDVFCGQTMLFKYQRGLWLPGKHHIRL